MGEVMRSIQELSKLSYAVFFFQSLYSIGCFKDWLKNLKRNKMPLKYYFFKDYYNVDTLTANITFYACLFSMIINAICIQHLTVFRVLCIIMSTIALIHTRQCEKRAALLSQNSIAIKSDIAFELLYVWDYRGYKAGDIMAKYGYYRFNHKETYYKALLEFYNCIEETADEIMYGTENEEELNELYRYLSGLFLYFFEPTCIVQKNNFCVNSIIETKKIQNVYSELLRVRNIMGTSKHTEALLLSNLYEEITRICDQEKSIAERELDIIRRLSEERNSK